MVFKETTLYVQYISYQKVKFGIKITRCWRDSSVFFGEATSCFLHDVYEVLIVFFWISQRAEHHNSGPIDLNREQDSVEAVDTQIWKKYWIYTYCQIEVMKNVKGITRSCNTMNVQVWCLSKAMNILFLVWFGHFFILYTTSTLSHTNPNLGQERPSLPRVLS